MRRQLTFREVDIFSGAALVVFGVIVLYRGLQLDFYAEGVPGPGFFPSLLAIALTICGAVTALTRLRVTRESAGEFRMPSRWQVKRSLGLWIAVLLASLSVGVLGFPLTMLLLVAVILLVIEGRRGIGSVVTIIAIPVLAWLLFASLLKVPLPTWPLGS